MSSNSSGPGTGSDSLPGGSAGSVGCSSASDDLRRLRTGKRGRPPIDPTQKGLAEVCFGIRLAPFSLRLAACLTW